MGNESNEKIKLAVVILNWNGKNFLEKFLPPLIEHSNIKGVHIIVADNCSSDTSIEFLRQKYPGVGLILLDRNYGFTGGYNRALKQIDAEYFVLLNSDIEVSNNWIEPVLEFMESHPEVAACQPKIKSYYQKEFFEYAGAAGGFIDKYGYPFCRGRILKEFEEDKGQYNELTEIFWATGACMFIRSDLYHLAGGLDEDFFAHMEEIDLCWRLKNMGYKIFCHPESVVYHVGGGTLPNNNSHKLYLNYRNNLFLLYKNLPSRNRFGIFLSRMFLDGISSLIYLFTFSFSNFFAVFKAHIHFYKSLSALKKKRKILSKYFNTYKHHEIYKRSIVSDYYIHKRKRFSDLKF